MTERIGIQFNATVSRLVSLFLEEAETDTFPYAVYNYEVTPVLTKDGVSGLSAELTCSVFSTDFDEAQEIAENISDAVAQDMRTDEFFAFQRSTSSNCDEGIWTVILTYNIKQSK